MVVVSAGHVGATRGSGIVSSAAGVLWMGVVRGMRGFGSGFTNPVGTWGMLDVCLCFGCGGVCGEWVGAWVRVGRGYVVLCLCEL